VLLGPLVPTTISRVLTSSRVRIGEVCQTMQTLVSLLALPIQLTLVDVEMAVGAHQGIEGERPLRGRNGGASFGATL